MSEDIMSIEELADTNSALDGIDDVADEFDYGRYMTVGEKEKIRLRAEIVEALEVEDKWKTIAFEKGVSMTTISKVKKIIQGKL